MGFTHLICQATLRAEQQPQPLEDSHPPLLPVPSRSWKKFQVNKWKSRAGGKRCSFGVDSFPFSFKICLLSPFSPTPLSPGNLKIVILSLSRWDHYLPIQKLGSQITFPICLPPAKWESPRGRQRREWRPAPRLLSYAHKQETSPFTTSVFSSIKWDLW
jgi:hypothetical protein